MYSPSLLHPGLAAIPPASPIIPNDVVAPVGYQETCTDPVPDVDQLVDQILLLLLIRHPCLPPPPPPLILVHVDQEFLLPFSPIHRVLEARSCRALRVAAGAEPRSRFTCPAGASSRAGRALRRNGAGLLPLPHCRARAPARCLRRRTIYWGGTVARSESVQAAKMCPRLRRGSKAWPPRPRSAALCAADSHRPP